jgi:DNA-binding response OmpR family regulator
MSQRTILVVDDEPFICRSLTFVLRKDNYRVLEARNGEEALVAIREHKPDLVFLDVMMPHRNGYEVLEAIKTHPSLKSCRVILLTAKGQEADRERGLQMGADEYMTKPFSPHKIIERARALLGVPQRQPH